MLLVILDRQNKARKLPASLEENGNTILAKIHLTFRVCNKIENSNSKIDIIQHMDADNKYPPNAKTYKTGGKIEAPVKYHF